MSLGTAQFVTLGLGSDGCQHCYITILLAIIDQSNYRALQARVLTVKWRGENKSTIMFMVFTEVLTGKMLRVSRKVRG